MNLQDLKTPYPAAEIEWRVGSTNSDKTSGLALAYLTARHVMERLDAVCGPENWQDRYEFHGARTVCYLSIRVGDDWITKGDGAGDSDVEAEKGAISDALKRAAVKWGIGRYLYDLGNIWVDLEPAGRSYKIKKNQYRKLQDVLDSQFGPTKMVDAPSQAPAEAPQPPKPNHSFDTYSKTLEACITLDDLQGAFKQLWRHPALTDPERTLLKSQYDTRKKNLPATITYTKPEFDHLQSALGNESEQEVLGSREP